MHINPIGYIIFTLLAAVIVGLVMNELKGPKPGEEGKGAAAKPAAKH
jgi:hypothetical protein